MSYKAHIKHDILDDLMREVFEMLLSSKNRISPTKNDAREEIGVLLELTNPRARLSTTETRGITPFSCLGEFLWYLTHKNELSFIEYYIGDYRRYSDDNKTLYGAYGPRLFNMRDEINQFRNVFNILKNKNDSRQAVVQIFDAVDLTKKTKDMPCTCTIQFMKRHGKLHVVTHMRSNDAFLGLPHDFFAFTMLQEIVACELGVELGTYKHFVGSLHLYDRDEDKVKRYLDEGLQSTMTPMPEMPKGDPWPAIEVVRNTEIDIRTGKTVNVSALSLDPYWADLIRLLQVFTMWKNKDIDGIESVKRDMHTDIYKAYIEQRKSQLDRD